MDFQQGLMIDFCNFFFSHTGRGQERPLLILAADLNEAIRIAEDNPEFSCISSATCEVRPVKTKVADIGFVH